MRQIISALAFIALLFVFQSMAFAQEDARNEDHEMLRALKTKVVDAFNKRDSAAIAACLTDNFAVTTIDQATLTSAEAIAGHFKKMFQSPSSFLVDMKISPEPEILTRFLSADTGYCYGKTHETYKMKDGRVVHMESRWTALVQREKGEWKIAALHAGVNFLDNPVLNAVKTKRPMMSVLSFIGGILLTLLCVYLALRAKRARNKIG